MRSDPRALRQTIVLLILLPGTLSGQTIWLGTNRVTPGQITEFAVAPNARAGMEAATAGRRITMVKGAVAVPDGFNLIKPRPILIVSVPSGGSAIRAVPGYTNAALPAGWLVIAADGPHVAVEEDTVQWGWGVLSSALDYVWRSWPQTKTWPVATAGFSGGAKRSATVAAAVMKEGRAVIGIFMGGCNEDRLTLGLQLYRPGEAFKQLPVFLSNGGADPIAGPQHLAPALESMRRSGFGNIRNETYQGGHQLNNEQLGLALRWFKQSWTRR
jgi:hypothetical protein